VDDAAVVRFLQRCPDVDSVEQRFFARHTALGEAIGEQRPVHRLLIEEIEILGANFGHKALSGRLPRGAAPSTFQRF